jgi:hypothetical protein
MTTRIAFSALLAALALSGCGTYTGVDEVAANGDPLQCRMIQQTGSGIAERFCATAEEWEAWEAGRSVETREWMRRVETSAARVTGGNSSPLSP